MHLLFTASQNQDHTVSYFISPELDQGSYSLNLRPDGTMDALIDGAEVSFSTSPNPMDFPSQSPIFSRGRS